MLQLSLKVFNCIHVATMFTDCTSLYYVRHTHIRNWVPLKVIEFVSLFTQTPHSLSVGRLGSLHCPSPYVTINSQSIGQVACSEVILHGIYPGFSGTPSAAFTFEGHRTVLDPGITAFHMSKPSQPPWSQHHIERLNTQFFVVTELERAGPVCGLETANPPYHSSIISHQTRLVLTSHCPTFATIEQNSMHTGVEISSARVEG